MKNIKERDIQWDLHIKKDKRIPASKKYIRLFTS